MGAPRSLRPGLAWLAIATGCGLAQASWAAPGEAWRDAFQSSPAAYAPVTPELERLLIEKLHFTAERVERLKPKPPVSGTLRFRLALTAGGSRVRIRLSNEEGASPLVLSSASVGLAASAYDVRPGSLRRLTFGAARGVTVPAGAPALSDAVDLAVSPGAELIVSIHVSDTLQLTPLGGGAMVLAAGDQTLSESLTGSERVEGRPFVSGVMVLAQPTPRVIVAIGDSITDANHAARGAETGSWPEQLAQRLTARSGGTPFAIANAGIGGNQLLNSGSGRSVLARLDRDTLRIEGLSHVIVLAGTNDIGEAGRGTGRSISDEDLIAGYRQVIVRVHARGAKVVIATIPPFLGAHSHYSVENEKIRQAVNGWIRSSGEPDAVVDFDRALRDTAAPDTMQSGYDSGDHLHPGPAGYAAMAAAIDLALFD